MEEINTTTKLIGLLSDTHDHLPLIGVAVKRLNEEGVGLVLHAGDYIAPFVIPLFKSLKAPLIGVFGNNDGEKTLLRKRFMDMGLQLRERFAEVKVDGLKIALLHGEEEELLQSLVNTKSYDMIAHGHTHEAETYRKGKTVVINPGEACGYLTGKPTIAIFNTQTLDVKILSLE